MRIAASDWFQMPRLGIKLRHSSTFLTRFLGGVHVKKCVDVADVVGCLDVLVVDIFGIVFSVFVLLILQSVPSVITHHND